MKKEQIYVYIKNETTKQKALEVLSKHNQIISPINEGLFDYNENPYLKFCEDDKVWVTSDYKIKRTEINVEKLDEILQESFTDFSSNLIEEATKRGFKKGCKIISPDGINRSFELTSEQFVYSNDTNTLFCKDSGINIFHNGSWAQIITEPNKSIKISPFPSVEKSVIQEAEEIINGSRAEDYGSVTENFTKIAVGWKEIFADGNFTPRRVAHAMVWLKICRDLNTPKRDNLVDGIGYFGCVEKMDNESNKQ